MKIKLSDGFETTIYKWEAKKPTSIMQIVHGSAEHAKRYEKLAKWLNTKGITVWSIDLRGHGALEAKRDNLGYFGKDGKDRVIEDINEITIIMKNEHPNLPYTLLGHSMGSFIVRMVALKYSNIDKLIVIGTNHQNRIKSSINHNVVKASLLLKRESEKNIIFDKMSYAMFDLKFKGEKKGAWLSRNKENIKNFNTDPLAGFTFTKNGFYTMSYWVNQINRKSLIKKQDKNKSILFLVGEEDPVGNMTKEVKKAFRIHKKYGFDLELIIYSKMRHEILNETKKMDVYNDILKFINKKST